MLKTYKITLKLTKDITTEFYVQAPEGNLDVIMVDVDFYFQGLTAFVEEINTIHFSSFAAHMKEVAKRL